MKHCIIVILALLTLQGFSQNISVLEKPCVDERVELLSIVFRLAENREYSFTNFKLYTDRIENHFGRYRDHELIRFTKEIAKSNGIGFDAVMSMAIHLDEDMNLLTDVAGNSLEKRWTRENAVKFVSLLRQFYRDTDFESFYAGNSGLYAEAVSRFVPVYEMVDLNWFSSFFGKSPKGRFIIVNGLGNGPPNYGPSVQYSNGTEEIYAIMGTTHTDTAGMPLFRTEDHFPTLIHEFNHSFVNYLTADNRELFRENGERIFEVLENEMKSQAYGHWETVLNEALVRAAVIKYMKDHDYSETEIDQAISYEKGRYFLWTEELVTELERYDSRRDQYPDLESYIPVLASAYVDYALIVKEFENQRPRVVSISEFANGERRVDDSIKTITLNFDVPLSGKGYSFYIGDKGKDAFPNVTKVEYANENQSVILYVELEKYKDYQFVVKGQRFVSVDGVSIRDYEVNFSTRK